jgi:hypothetical protein
VLPDRCQETVKGLLASIPERLKAPLTQGGTDRDDALINAAREGPPHARGVIDRFPVAQA